MLHTHLFAHLDVKKSSTGGLNKASNDDRALAAQLRMTAFTF